MIRFECDYTEGAHPLIMQKLLETNMEQTIGYGNDNYCEHARELIREACKQDKADVHFLVGGTQANTTVIASILKAHQGVIAADTGHINVHETGAIEATGHKVLALPGKNGKINAAQIAEYVDEHWADSDHEHMVQPGMVYISQPTEYGTTYSKKELEDIYKVCQDKAIYLFVDGARLGYALAANDADWTLPDLAANCDVFYIGGTKVGALFGEAVVITNPVIQKDFRYSIKQHGGMLAKGRLLGIQFETLFTNNLYYSISKHAIDCAMQVKEAFVKKGYSFLYESSTNQQFPIISTADMEKLSSKYTFSTWAKYDDSHYVVRFCTSWATKEENVKALCDDIANL